MSDDARKKVTSVGNSWIVCKSKSHPGHVYYFNTLTGEAAWNLSDAEIEKAQSRTKHLECLPGVKLSQCPEPRDKPPSIFFNNGQPPLRPMDKPFLEQQSQSPILTFPNFGNNAANFNPLHNLLSSFNVNSTTIYNPRVWSVAPIINQTNTSDSLQVAYNNLSQTMSQPAPGLFLNGFDNTRQSGIITTDTRTFFPREFNQIGQKKGNKNVEFINKNNYLRQKLLLKKKNNKAPFVTSRFGGLGVNRSNSRKTDNNSHNSFKVEATLPNDLSGGTTETRCMEPSSKINLEPLKCLAQPNSNSDAWFIVVDLDVLLNEFKFLTTLTDSDAKCYLMVPKKVMQNLEAYITRTGNIQARRILRFLSQQVEIGYAFIAEDTSEQETDSMTDIILETCTELLEKNYHLILLTNDNELLNFKNSSNINMFSIEDVKKLLTDTPNKQVISTGSKSQIKIDDVVNRIKIIVPNNTTQNTTTTVKDIELHKDIPLTQSKPKEDSTQSKTEETIVIKRTMDAGIQTDFEEINSSVNKMEVVEKPNTNTVSNSLPQNNNKVASGNSMSSNINVSGKKREIKLKRCVSYQPTTIACDTVKKQFKWRRRRITSLQVDKGVSYCNEQNKNTKIVESQPENKSIRPIRLQRTFNNNPPSKQNENKIAENSIDGRESSIGISATNSTLKESITIEETSSSGIISNSESNVDAESISTFTINKQKLVPNQNLNIDKCYNQLMYKIDSKAMEEYLKMKSDEWVSRFIQIMEEVLTQVLQQDPPFSHSDMPPPWTLHEAAQCVAMKMSDNNDIRRAVDKLSNILFRVSDSRGKIILNISPCQYMEMYSYGVHLLDAIRKVINTCEDVQIASESLNKLLEDIRNPNMDISANDTFTDNIHENILNNEVTEYSDMPGDNSESAINEQTTPKNSRVQQTNISPAKTTQMSKELTKPVKFIRNIDVQSSFFESLRLKKVLQGNNKNQFHENVSDLEAGESNNRQDPSVTTNKDTDNASHNQPKIVRKFSLCQKFEKKIKNVKTYENYDDDLDYEEDYDEYVTEEYCAEDDDNLQSDDVDVNNIDEESDANQTNSHDSLSMNEDTKKFKYMMCMFLQEIKESLCQVRILCNQCFKELNDAKQSSGKKSQLRSTAERAHLHVIRLCKSLESMVDHENNNPSRNMCNLLEQAGINISHVDERLLLEYRMTVTRCMDYADEFQQSIQSIISSFSS